MSAIINAELVVRDHFVPEALLFVEDGKIAVGKRADLFFVDRKMNVEKVLPGGALQP